MKECQGLLNGMVVVGVIMNTNGQKNQSIHREVLLTWGLSLLSSALIGVVVHTLMWKTVDAQTFRHYEVPSESESKGSEEPAEAPAEAPSKVPASPKRSRAAFSLPA